MKTEWKVEAKDKLGRVFTSHHATKELARQSAANCRGRYPYGNRVKVVKVESDDKKCEICGSTRFDDLGDCDDCAGQEIQKKPVFQNCNVCGRQLVRTDELAVGMCAICANETVDGL